MDNPVDMSQVTLGKRYSSEDMYRDRDMGEIRDPVAVVYTDQITDVMLERYVWVVHYDNYGDRWLEGVYDSEDKVAEFQPQDPTRPWRCPYKIVKTRLY